jgi:Mn2+/Fe2+ NRAMP family transporter
MSPAAPLLNPTNKEDRKEASKTYLEQIKLLITLASTFIVAPAVLYKDLEGFSPVLLIFMEACFILSVVLGYVAVGSIAGTQFDGGYNIYRRATKYSSLAQLGSYLVGMILFTVGFLSQPLKENVPEQKKKMEQSVLIRYPDTLAVQIIVAREKRELPLQNDSAKNRPSAIK